MHHTLASRPVRIVLVALLACALAAVGAPVPAHATTATEITGSVVPPAGDLGAAWFSRLVITATTSSSENSALTATVDDSGAFTITGLKASTPYSLTFRDPSGQAQRGWAREDGALAVSRYNAHTFTAGTSGVTLAPQRAGTIAGELDLSEILPEFVHGDVTFWLFRESFDSTADDGRISVDADGTFSRTDLPAGESFYLQANQPWLNRAWVTADGTLSPDRADRVAIPVGATNLRVTGGPGVARPGLSGTVAPVAGVDLSEVRIRAYEQGTSGGWGTATMYDEKVQADGRFFVGGLKEATSYRLRVFAPAAALSGYVGAGGKIVRTIEEAVDVPAGSNVDVTLSAAETITGKVVVHPDVVRATLEVTARGSGPQRSVYVAADGGFTIPGLWPDERVLLRVDNRYPPSGKEGALGYVGAGGVLFVKERDAATFTAGARDVHAIIEPLVTLSGTVELPAGFVHDTEDAPRIEALREHSQYGETFWTPRASGDVGADGSFALEGTHPREDYQLRLTWPDGTIVYWTSDHTVPTSLEAQASTTTPRSDVVLPLRDAPPPAPQPEAVAPQVAAKVVKKGTTRSKVRLKVTVRSSATPAPTGRIEVRFAGTTRSFALKAKHRGARFVKVPRTKARGKVQVRYVPTGSSATLLTSAATTTKVTKVAPKVKVKTTKRISRTTRPKVTVRVTTPLTTKPTGKVRITYGKRTRTVQLKARHKGKVTVRLPRLAKGKHKIRAKYTPATRYKSYLKAARSKKLTVRAR